MTAKISIIIINWNGVKLLADSLQSLSRQTYPAREIILVDNGSTDSSVSFVKESFPEIKIIQLSVIKDSREAMPKDSNWQTASLLLSLIMTLGSMRLGLRSSSNRCLGTRLSEFALRS